MPNRRALILVALLAMAVAIFLILKRQRVPEEGDKTGALGGGIHLASRQSTLGAYVGRLALEDGKGVRVVGRHADGKDDPPSASEARKPRPAR